MSTTDTARLGRTGRRVSRMGMGALPLSWEGRPGRAAARQVVWRALDLGITLFDTADSYCLHAGETGHNERLMAEALRARPGTDVLVATKGGLACRGRRREQDGRPAHLRRACEASLRALGVEQIGLYQLHAPDPRVPFADSVGTLAQLRAEGKIRHAGLSNVTAEQLRQAMEIVEIASVQNPLNPWHRADEASGLLALCAAEGVSYLAHSPLGGARRVGVLGSSPALREIGRRLGATPAELVLGWMTGRFGAVIPIPGASRVASVESTARAAALRLDGETLAALETAFAALPAEVRAAA